MISLSQRYVSLERWDVVYFADTIWIVHTNARYLLWSLRRITNFKKKVRPFSLNKSQYFGFYFKYLFCFKWLHFQFFFWTIAKWAGTTNKSIWSSIDYKTINILFATNRTATTWILTNGRLLMTNGLTTVSTFITVKRSTLAGRFISAGRSARIFGWTIIIKDLQKCRNCYC